MPPSGPGDLPLDLLRLANAIVRELIPVVGKFDLTPQQVAVLFRVASLDKPPSLAALGRALSVSKQNVTGMAGRLVEAGLLQREGDPGDLRASRLSLTRRGEEVVRKLRPAVRDWSDAWLAILPAPRKQGLEEAVARLLARLDGA